MDVPAASLTGLIGQAPADAPDLPALSGELIAGRSLAVVGRPGHRRRTDRGSGVVTVIGFDPATDWIADARSPTRSGAA